MFPRFLISANFRVNQVLERKVALFGRVVVAFQAVRLDKRLEMSLPGIVFLYW